jgi:hypothetical protein
MGVDGLSEVAVAVSAERVHRGDRVFAGHLVIVAAAEIRIAGVQEVATKVVQQIVTTDKSER